MRDKLVIVTERGDYQIAWMCDLGDGDYDEGSRLGEMHHTPTEAEMTDEERKGATITISGSNGLGELVEEADRLRDRVKELERLGDAMADGIVALVQIMIALNVGRERSSHEGKVRVKAQEAMVAWRAARKEAP